MSLDALADFLARESEAYAAEVVAWHFWSSAVSAVCAAVVAILLTRLVWVLRRDPEGLSAMFLAGVAWIVTLGYLGYAVKAHVAPRAVVIEHLTGK